MNVNHNIELFQNLISCTGDIFVWSYDADGQLLQSNCPHEGILDGAFSLFGCKTKMLDRANERCPITLGTSHGLLWSAAFEFTNNELSRCFVIGPICTSFSTSKSIEYGFEQYSHLDISLAWKNQLISLVDDIPVLQNITFEQYTLMLHFCVTGEKIRPSDINTIDKSELSIDQLEVDSRNRHEVWLAERAMLDMVRTGSLDYQSALDKPSLLSNGVPVRNNDALRQGKISLIVFTSLVCRAAIEGGLSAELAYSLGDSYIQTIEDYNDFSDLMPISKIMFNDFVQRVHKTQTNPKLSKPIQLCCDHIKQHLNDKNRASDLAKLVGYSEYYITRKFKEETGMNIVEYSLNLKIERAKSLLTSSSFSIQEIAAQLGFCSSSYFSQKFREITKFSPMEYRDTDNQLR